ncbi:hypothetical protein Vafri_16377 [Volvox africanus]|uniref:Uncharacterized protein n=1 Tax=Volvox africanus TaxID=51714 RepID=A0A8J4F6D9_9CHLO|nr:hypothetical protein Vafri_16377 [Volvox africanus]
MSRGGGHAPGTAPKPAAVPCHKSGSKYGVPGALWCPLTCTARDTAARCTRWVHPSPAVVSRAQSRVCGYGASGGGGGGSNVGSGHATAATRRPPGQAAISYVDVRMADATAAVATAGIGDREGDNIG